MFCVSRGMTLNPFVTFDALPKSSTRNRFRLPPIDKKFLDAIEKGDYVDFEKMKKKRLDMKSREANKTDYDLKVNEHSSDTTLSLKKSKRDSINNFTEWMSVWNDFLHARLHYKPHEAYELLKYQKYITDFAKIYKFEAIKAYDIDFRNTIANQKADPPEERTAFWDQQSTELKNVHLVDNPKPPPQCYNCTEKGHVSSDCPKPQKNKNNQSKNNNTTNYQSQSNYYPQNVPSVAYNPFYPPPTPPTNHTLPRNPNRPPTSSAPQELDVNNTDDYCRGLNATGTCTRGFRCKWLHYCNRCKEPDHGGIACTKHTSTRFRG